MVFGAGRGCSHQVQYAAELVSVLEPLKVKWIEEPLMPDEYAAHASQLSA